mgnify:CR=1 FL=1
MNFVLHSITQQKRDMIEYLTRYMIRIKLQNLDSIAIRSIDSMIAPAIQMLVSKNGKVINVCNAPSPAATACFAIGEEITNLI